MSASRATMEMNDAMHHSPLSSAGAGSGAGSGDNLFSDHMANTASPGLNGQIHGMMEHMTLTGIGGQGFVVDKQHFGQQLCGGQPAETQIYPTSTGVQVTNKGISGQFASASTNAGYIKGA